MDNKTVPSILIVDDDPIDLEVFEAYVGQSLKFDVAVAKDGIEALEALESKRFDLVISDIKMPRMNGIELLKRIHDQYPMIGVIMLTGFAEDYTFVQMINFGANDFTLKPVSIGELEAKINRVLRERRLIADLKEGKEKVDKKLLENKRLSEELARSEEKYRSLFNATIDGVAILNMETLKILDANPSFCSMIGYKRAEIQDLDITEIHLEGEWERAKGIYKMAAENGSCRVSDLTLETKNDGLMVADVSMSQITYGSTKIIHCLFRDVSERRELEDNLAELSLRDGMTNLYNHRHLQSFLSSEIRRAAKANRPLSLLFADLDNFKSYNDTKGHQAGDEVISAMGEMIRSSTCRTNDAGFRYGGDEFAVVLPDTALEGAQKVAERLLKIFSEKALDIVSVSIGVAELDTGMSATALVEKADKLVYKAKKTKGSHICFAAE
ncbi:diguanylate cyclase [Candidatus Hydrogenedentota bacterium]